MHSDRRERLDTMIALFKRSNRGWTVKELAAHFCLSERQIQYDLQDIMSDPDYAPLISRRRGLEYVHMVTAYRERCRG
jgi:predicted DNA-binding transcriptional regulator YafY